MAAITSTLNPFLSNNFAPIKEEITAEDLKVIGELPPELSGMLCVMAPIHNLTQLENIIGLMATECSMESE